MSFQTTFLDESSLPGAPSSKTPTNLLSNRRPIHRWANFIAGYSPELVSTAIRDADLPQGATVLDPFAGFGTTLVQAMLEGFHVIGAEANPYFADIAEAKCLAVQGDFDSSEVFDRLRAITPAQPSALDVYSPDALKFLRKLFPLESLLYLCHARDSEPFISEKSRPLYRLVVSCLLESLSSSQTDGVYKAPATLKRANSYTEALGKIEMMVKSDLALSGRRSVSQFDLLKGSALALNPDKCGLADLCVTSPPYLNNFDYTEMSRMELYFWSYADSWGDITEKFRSLQVPNTTTVPTRIKKNHLAYREKLSAQMISKLDPLVSTLAAIRKEKGGSKDYNTLVYPYFETMKSILNRCHQILRVGAPIHVIIGDAYLYGIHIPTGEITRMILDELGFENLEMKLLRTRGTRWLLAKRDGAGTPIGEYAIYAKRA